MNRTKTAGWRWFVLCAGIFSFFAASGMAHAADNRFTLAGQSDWNGKLGFYVDLEDSSPGTATCALADLKLAMGIADGANWRFIVTSPAWQYSHTYHVHAVIDPQGASLWLDGALVQQSAGGFQPDNGDLTAASVPGWASAAAEYKVVQETLTVSSASAGARHVAFADGSKKNLALSLFTSINGQNISGWHPRPSDTVTIDTTFHLAPAPRWQDFAPMVDRYGQCVYANWPGKVTNDDQINAAARDEARRLAVWSASNEFDKFGGCPNAGWKEKPTGFYRVVKRDGVWWLITPAGTPCFYTGLCTAPNEPGDFTPVTDRTTLYAELPPRTGLYAGAWGHDVWGENSGADYVAFAGVTEIRLNGSDWRKHEDDLAARRIRAWGFSGVGKWGGIDGVPNVPVLDHGGVPNIARHPDIFDPAIQAQFRASLAAQITPHLNDPYVVGWSLGNEYDEIITPDEITAILGKDESVPAKLALVDYALKTIYGGDISKMAQAWQVAASTPADLYQATPKPPAADIEALRQFYARSYYGFIYNTVKSIDPNHLYLGFWIVPYWWVNETDWSLIAPYCDVIGYDHYASTFTDPNLTRWMQSTNKPVLCGEFSFPPDYSGQRAFGTYSAVSVRTDTQAGDRYIQWVKDASRNPYCVGVCWFEYRDEPITGRGPGRGTNLIYGEDYAFGLVDVTDRPKWDLVTRVRQANLSAARWRLGYNSANKTP